MNERLKTPQNSSEEVDQNIEEVQLPQLLDVIKVDGRWAQIVRGPIRRLDRDELPDSYTIIWLDTKKGDYVKIREYDMFPYKGMVVDGIRSQMSDKEFMNVHWDSLQQKDNPEIRKFVTVFGEFRRRVSGT